MSESIRSKVRSCKVLPALVPFPHLSYYPRMRTTSLAAILFVELAGFTELLARDEPRALGLLDAYRTLVDPLIAEHGGELVDATGDELLIVFGSAVGAVQCAIHLRLSACTLGRARPLDERLSPRAGIHLGEIWRDENRVYGNGVNVAARVKAEAGPGQILISEDVWRQVANKLDLSMRQLAGRSLKNIERPLDIYEILEAVDSTVEAETAGRDETATGPPLGEARRPGSRETSEAARAAARSAVRAVAREAIGRAIAKSIADATSSSADAAISAGEKAKAAANKAEVTVLDGGEGKGLGLRITMGDDEGAGEAGADLSDDNFRDLSPQRLVGPSEIAKRQDKARTEISKGFTNFIVAAAIFGGCMYYYSTTQSFIALGAGALIGLGPALSGLKRFIKGAFDLRDAKRDGKSLEDGRG